MKSSSNGGSAAENDISTSTSVKDVEPPLEIKVTGPEEKKKESKGEAKLVSRPSSSANDLLGMCITNCIE